MILNRLSRVAICPVFLLSTLSMADVMYAKDADEARKKRKAFLAKWRLRCRGVADSLEEAGDRLFTFLRYPPRQGEPLDRG